ncbi:hypothetical protein [Nostoc sp. CCY0012]|uniref:hypothetical protein n=1 Tax=Nostoc sp. CCY0012 TaxID=1056123 RepID=UPI0039C66ADD
MSLPCIYTDQAKKLEDGMLALGGDRKSAFKAFKGNVPLIKEIEQKIERITYEDKEKARHSLESYIKYLNQVLKEDKVDIHIREQVEMEIQEIDTYLEDLDVII